MKKFIIIICTLLLSLSMNTQAQAAACAPVTVANGSGNGSLPQIASTGCSPIIFDAAINVVNIPGPLSLSLMMEFLQMEQTV